VGRPQRSPTRLPCLSWVNQFRKYSQRACVARFARKAYSSSFCPPLAAFGELDPPQPNDLSALDPPSSFPNPSRLGDDEAVRKCCCCTTRVDSQSRLSDRFPSRQMTMYLAPSPLARHPTSGSPGRREASPVVMVNPVTCRAVWTTSDTENPWPLRRLEHVGGPLRTQPVCSGALGPTLGKKLAALQRSQVAAVLRRLRSMRNFCWDWSSLDVGWNRCGHAEKRIWRFFERRNITFKKPCTRREQKRVEIVRARRRWMRQQGMFDAAGLVFIDET